MNCMYYDIPKGISQAEAMSNSKKIKPVALAMLSYTCLKASVSSQSVSQSAENSTT